MKLIERTAYMEGWRSGREGTDLPRKDGANERDSEVA